MKRVFLAAIAALAMLSCSTDDAINFENSKNEIFNKSSRNVNGYEIFTSQDDYDYANDKNHDFTSIYKIDYLKFDLFLFLNPEERKTQIRNMFSHYGLKVIVLLDSDTEIWCFNTSSHPEGDVDEELRNNPSILVQEL